MIILVLVISHVFILGLLFLILKRLKYFDDFGYFSMPMYPTKDAAYEAYGEVYQHYKGGVYRVLDIRAGQVYMEHLWPHPRSTHWRPVTELTEIVDGRQRFERI